MKRDKTDERTLWNEKFRSGWHASGQPDPFLVDAYRDYVDPLLGDGRARQALDLAGGSGRHAIFLAERGWDVTLLDVSEVGLERARMEAEKRGLSLKLQNDDAKLADLGRGQFDLIVVFFFLERELFLAIFRALKSGGILIYKTYTVEHPRLSGGKGPQHPMHLLESNELLRAFACAESFRAPDVGGRNLDGGPPAQETPLLQILFYRETVMDKGVAELAARK